MNANHDDLLLPVGFAYAVFVFAGLLITGGTMGLLAFHPILSAVPGLALTIIAFVLWLVGLIERWWAVALFIAWLGAVGLVHWLVFFSAAASV